MENWLPGGPYFEVSFITLNSCNIENILETLKQLKYNIKINEPKEIVKDKIKMYFDKINVNMTLNIYISIHGKRRSTIYIEYLSDEIMKIDFCFLGEEYTEKPITEKTIPEFKIFLEDLMKLFNGIVGIIGWEEDCTILFDTDKTYPHKDYSRSNLKHYTNNDLLKYNKNGHINGVEEIIWNEDMEK